MNNPTPLDCAKNQFLLNHRLICDLHDCQLCRNIQTLNAMHMRACRGCNAKYGSFFIHQSKRCSRSMNVVSPSPDAQPVEVPTETLTTAIPTEKPTETPTKNDNANTITPIEKFWWEL